MYYFAQFNGLEGYTVTARFRDIPEIIVSGTSKAETITLAEQALFAAITNSFLRMEKFPLASEGMEQEVAVYVPETVYAKVLLHNVMIDRKVKKSELARLLDTNPPEIQRILDLKHRTKIDTIGRALALLNAPLKMSV
ncbi:MAG: hypothetical protein J6M05_00105 [Cardiobacteriaceae bacterium]|nr:hypothetical protein [Cardiobacteriaceae bacterium]